MIGIAFIAFQFSPHLETHAITFGITREMDPAPERIILHGSPIRNCDPSQAAQWAKRQEHISNMHYDLTARISHLGLSERREGMEISPLPQMKMNLINERLDRLGLSILPLPSDSTAEIDSSPTPEVMISLGSDSCDERNGGNDKWRKELLGLQDQVKRIESRLQSDNSRNDKAESNKEQIHPVLPPFYQHQELPLGLPNQTTVGDFHKKMNSGFPPSSAMDRRARHPIVAHPIKHCAPELTKKQSVLQAADEDIRMRMYRLGLRGE